MGSAVEVTDAFKGLITKIGLDATFRDWCERNDILDVDDFGTLAAKEDLVEKKILDNLDAKITEGKMISVSVKVTKLWRACRSIMDAEEKAKVSGSSTDLEKPLDDTVKEALDATWLKRHNFNLSDSRLLVDNMVGRVYREVNATPPKFPVLFLEQLRTRASLERKTTLALVVKAGEVPRSTEVVADTVNGSFEIFLRGRALFSSIAFVSVQRCAWFTYEDAEFFSEKLLGYVNQEFRGRRPPLAFYVNAWAVTMQRMSEGVRTGGGTLSTVVRNTATWENLWTQWSPNDDEKITAPDDDDLRAELERTRRMAASLQSQRDSAERQRDAPFTGNRKGKGKGGSGRGNGGNGGGDRRDIQQDEPYRGHRGGAARKRITNSSASFNNNGGSSGGNGNRDGGARGARWGNKRGR